MELIKRKIILNGLQVSGNTIFPLNFIQPDYKIGIHLTQTFENIGLYTDLIEKDSKEIFNKTEQLAIGGGTLVNGIGIYIVPNNIPFITINNINESDLVSQISIGTELKISFNNITDIVIVTNIIGPNNSIMRYRLNKLISGLSSFDQVNITVGNISSVFLSEYVGTDNSGSGEIITTNIPDNFQLSDFITNQNYIITGKTDSKLNEVKTFLLNDPFIINKPEQGNKWIRNISIEQDTNREFIEYTITPIDYKTYTDNGETIYKIPSNSLSQIGPEFYTGPILSGWNVNNSSLLPSVKEEMKMGLVQSPEIDSDIFINRREISVFENHLRLNEIIGVEHLVEYQRRFFNIDKQ